MTRTTMLGLVLGALFVIPASGVHAQGMALDGWLNGAVRIGPSNLTCDASREGSIRYNSTSDIIDFCNGTVWANVGSGGATPAGANTQVQYNDGGAFGGDAGLTYDETNDALTISGKVTLGAIGGLSAPNSALVAGSNTQIQFNNSGNFGASANLLWDNTTSRLTVNGAVVRSPVTVNLTADNQLVTTAGRSYIQLSSNNATATNRTFCFDAGTSGQVIIVQLSSANPAEIVDNSTGCTSSVATQLAADATWTPGQYDIRTFIYEGSNWLQVSGSDN